MPDLLLPSSGTPPDDRVDVSPAELAGTWRNASRGGAITFSDDGAFAAVGLPHEMFTGFTRAVLPEDFDKDRDVITASSTWRLGGPIGDLEGPHNRVTLSVDELMGRPGTTSTALRAERNDVGTVVLAYYIGDPDLNHRVVYEKCAPNCPTVTPRPAAPTPRRS